MVEQFADRKAIAARLRKARVDAGVAAKTVYERFDLTRAGFYHWETGKSAPSIDQFLLLCRLYRTNPSYVLTGKDDWPFLLVDRRRYEALPELAKGAAQSRMMDEVVHQEGKLHKGNGTRRPLSPPRLYLVQSKLF